MTTQAPLRPFQREALTHLSKPRTHLLCVSPTGSGKSRIFQEYLLRTQAPAVLLSPLVALARQHEHQLKALGISASTGIDPNSQVWILSPESLTLPGVWEALTLHSPKLIVVDECHCLWEWGESFRPAFHLIPPLLKLPSVTHSLWLTATLLHEQVKKLKTLCNEHGSSDLTVMGAFSLPVRLHIGLSECEGMERLGALFSWIELNGPSGIVFCSTRDQTRRLERSLSAASVPVRIYHAGLSSEERQSIEGELRGGKELVVIATSAFGMGMDFPQLDWAVIFGAPTSVLALAQAMGRVGRGDKGGSARVLWSPWDFEVLKGFLPDTPEHNRRLRELEHLLRLPQLTTRAFQAHLH